MARAAVERVVDRHAVPAADLLSCFTGNAAVAELDRNVELSDVVCWRIVVDSEPEVAARLRAVILRLAI